MKKTRSTIILILITLLVSFATVVVFPVLPINFSWGSFKLQQNLGSEVWVLPKLGELKMDLKKGLDLQGGLQLVYSVDLSRLAPEDREEAFEGVRAVIDRRVNFFGVAEANIQTARFGDQRKIIVELPGITNVEEALSLIGRTAQLDFRTRGINEQGEDSFVPSPLTGAFLKKSGVQFDSITGKAVVTLSFNEEGAKIFKELTEKNVGMPLAIYLDDYLVTAPTVDEPIIDGSAIIRGDFTADEAKNLSIQLNSGALPAPVKVIEQRTIGASLGDESVRMSIAAGFVGLCFVIFFMIGNYGFLGILASVGLIIYALLTLMLYKIIPVTLTLSGIAGFILSVGMAVDANILIFERLKEELRGGLVKKLAIEQAFGRAWESIRDANINTTIIGLILWNPFNWGFLNTSGVVKGFALTLLIGICLSLFTGVVIVRNLLRLGLQHDD